MPRNMSFALTTPQFKAKTKTVTRRLGWWFLNPGDIVQGVEKAMGLKKGEKIKRLSQIKVLTLRTEMLKDITQDDVIKEGFPDWTPVFYIQHQSIRNKGVSIYFIKEGGLLKGQELLTLIQKEIQEGVSENYAKGTIC